MNDFEEYARVNQGKQVLISAVSGKFGGTLTGGKTNEEGKIIALVIQQYLHRTEVPTDEILSVRLM